MLARFSHSCRICMKITLIGGIHSKNCGFAPVRTTKNRSKSALGACLGLSWACLGLRCPCLQTFLSIVLSGIAATRLWCSALSACLCPVRCSKLEPQRFCKHGACIAAGNSCWLSLSAFCSPPAARRYVRSTWNWSQVGSKSKKIWSGCGL